MLTENLTGQVQFHIILARCFAVMKAYGVSSLVSFSDPLPRRALDETIVHKRLIGTIYQAFTEDVCW